MQEQYKELNTTPYYKDKIESLCEMFGTKDIQVSSDSITINKEEFPIVDDVIILVSPSEYPESLQRKLGSTLSSKNHSEQSDLGIQYTFGQEWTSFPEILPDHKEEFDQYFDLIDLTKLGDKRVCDLGCGIGRWSHFLTAACKEIVLVDFSDAIFVARKNLADSNNCLFFLADLRKLPFSENFCDLLFSLGVLHHLPDNALEQLRKLKPYSSRFLIYLYYALDNRPLLYKLLWKISDPLRKSLAKIKSNKARMFLTKVLAAIFYLPLILTGKVLDVVFNFKSFPIYEAYKNKGWENICQDCYDRFFTGIEQRFSRKQILELSDTFNSIKISDDLPYWHFLCED